MEAADTLELIGNASDSSQPAFISRTDAVPVMFGHAGVSRSLVLYEIQPGSVSAGAALCLPGFLEHDLL
jgi:hypothetical protein